MKNSSRCSICLKKGCKDFHKGIDQYIYFNKGQCFLSKAGKDIFGKNYLEEVREKSVGELQVEATARGYSNFPPGYNQNDL